MKKNNILFISICFLLLIGSIYFNINTINSAKERIITEINNTPIKETVEQETEEPVIEGTEAEATDPLMAIEDDSKSYTNKELSIIIITSIVAIISILTILVTKLGTTTIIDSLSTTKSKIYYVASLIILCSIIPTYLVIQSDNKVLNGSDTKDRDEKSIALVEITKDKKNSSLKKETESDDTSVIQVSNQANYIGTNLNLTKLSGISTDKESSLYYGLNSAFIVKDGATAELKNSTITTNAKYSSAFFATGVNVTATLDKIDMTTSNDYSSALSVSDGSNITASNLNIKTNGLTSEAIKVNDEESSVTINDSTLYTKGSLSPILYALGKIEATNITATSENSNIAIVEGINRISITDSELTTNAFGIEENRLASAFLMYKETPLTASENMSAAEITLNNSKITIPKNSPNYETSPIFLITNTKAQLNITNTTFKYGSDILLDVRGNDLFGDIGNNGAEVSFTSTDANLKGNVLVDELSNVSLYLNNTSYKGQINNQNLSKQVSVTFDKTSTWELTGDSYLNTLTLHNGRISRLRTCIDSNGYDIYYNANNNEWLEGRTIRLLGGGKLIPVFES